MLDKSYFTYLSNIIILIIIIHLIGSFFIGDNYNYTRIITSFILSITIIFFIIKETDLISNTLIENKFLFIFISTPIFFSYYSSFINTKAEIYQHTLISLTYFFFMFLIIFLTKNIKYISLKRFLNLFLLINIVIFILVFTYYILFIPHVDLISTIKRFFTNIRYLNHLQTLFIPLLWLYYSLIRSNNIKLLILVSLVINFHLLFYTGGRGSLYAIGISTILILLISKKSIKKDFLNFILIFIFSFLFYQLIFNDTSIKVSHLNNFTSNGRMDIYTTLLPYVIKLEHIFQPIGFASQDTALYGFLHPHNLLLFIFLGGGSFFLFLFLIILIIYFKNIWFIFKKRKNKTQTYFLFTFVSVFIHSFVSGLYITPLTLILFSYFLIFFNKYFAYPKSTQQTYFFSNIIKKLSICILLTLILLNLFYLKKTYDIYLKYKISEEELKNKYNNIRSVVPGIMLFDTKIIK